MEIMSSKKKSTGCFDQETKLLNCIRYRLLSTLPGPSFIHKTIKQSNSNLSTVLHYISLLS
jgi:hypothetical protein